MKKMLSMVVAVFIMSTATAQQRTAEHFCRLLDIVWSSESMRVDEMVNQLRDAGFPETKAEVSIIDTLGHVLVDCYVKCKSSEEKFALEYEAMFPRGAVAVLFIRTDNSNLILALKNKVVELKELHQTGVEIKDESEVIESVDGFYNASMQITINWNFVKKEK